MIAALFAVVATTAVGLVTPAPAYAAPVPKPNPRQWHLSETWRVETQVWPQSQGEGVTVAVIDTGVNTRGHYLPEMSDDFVLPGVDFIHEGGDGRYDSNGHGTEMAELIASRGAQGGFVGLAPKAKILPVRIISGKQVTQGIRWAVDHGAKVINVSVAGIAINEHCSPAHEEAIAYAVAHDVIIVAGAGNDGNSTNSTEQPSSCAGVTAVGAVDRSAQPWEKTQRKPYVVVAAPGAGLPVKDMYGDIGLSNGTSNSSALVSATMALVRAKFPDLPAREVVRRVIASAEDTGPKGKDDTTGYGLVNPGRALTGNVSKDAPNPVFDRFDALQAAHRAAADDRARNSLLLKVGGGLCLGLVVLVPLLLLTWSVRRGRRARRSIGATTVPPHAPTPPYVPYKEHS
ncbi:MAG TPA: S8 family serine peptidase [Planosporangium sp.]|nr:S8 family serine peptidase [Planosporangium sp.]